MSRTRSTLALAALLLATTLLPGVSAFPVPVDAVVEPLGPRIDATATPTPIPDSMTTPSGQRIVSPYGVDGVEVSGLWGDPVQPSGQGFLPAGGSYATLVNELGQSEVLTPARVAALIDDYLRSVGYHTPGAAVAFEENGSLAYTHVLGDIDGDGYDDILMDTYCTDPEPCMPRTILNLQTAASYASTLRCSWPHKLDAVSGRTGLPLWNRTLDANHPQGGSVGCRNEYVVGLLPVPGELPRIVMHRYELMYALGRGAMQITNTVYLLTADGQQTWNKVFRGHIYEAGFLIGGAISTSNMLVLPILQVPPSQGLVTIPKGQQPNLILQGVGFNISFAGSPVALPYATDYHVFLFNYQPDEWAMGVEPVTGNVLWRHDTFQPDERIPMSDGRALPDHPGPPVPISNRSVFPVSLQSPPLPHTRCVYDPSVRCPPFQQFQTLVGATRTGSWYWNHQPCCYDLTGDQVPDLVYTVYEWTTTPTTNYEGPQMIDSRLVVRDGATGNVVYDRFVRRDIPFNPGLPAHAGQYQMQLEALGDVNADGATDYLLHEYYFDWDFYHNLTLLDGPTGTAIWEVAHRRDFRLLPIGDTNGDGAPDLAFFDFTFDASWYADTTSRPNLTKTPLLILDGTTGKERLRMDTFMAPNDLIFYFSLARLNGVLDLDGDGAGELVTDDPLFLPDLTTVHRLAIRSTRDGAALHRMVSAGVFAFPTIVGDVNGDGLEDLLLLNGDIVDLWGTLYDGQTGNPLYARRILTSKSASYFSAAPLIRTQSLQANGSLGTDFLLNFQLNVLQVYQSPYFTFVTQSTRPQIARFDGLRGEIPWAVPALWDANFSILVNGASPASQMYQNAFLYDAKTDRVPTNEVSVAVQAGVGAAAFAAAFGLSFLLAARRVKP